MIKLKLQYDYTKYGTNTNLVIEEIKKIKDIKNVQILDNFYGDNKKWAVEIAIENPDPTVIFDNIVPACHKILGNDDEN